MLLQYLGGKPATEENVEFALKQMSDKELSELIRHEEGGEDLLERACAQWRNRYEEQYPHPKGWSRLAHIQAYPDARFVQRPSAPDPDPEQDAF